MVVSHRCRRWSSRACGTTAVAQLITGTKEWFQCAELDAAQHVTHVFSPPDVGGGDRYATLARAGYQPPQLLSSSADVRAVQDVERADHTDGGADRCRGLGCGSLGCCWSLRVVVEIGSDEWGR